MHLRCDTRPYQLASLLNDKGCVPLKILLVNQIDLYGTSKTE